MRRFFAEINNGLAVFTSNTLKHIKVLRINLNEEVEIVNEGKVYLASFTSLNPLECKIIKELDVNRELKVNSVLFAPLLKRDNFEFVLQKAVELGVKEIYPYVSSRVIKRVSKSDFENKRERFESIILNAAEQSNRTVIPKLHSLSNLEDLAKLKIDTFNKFIAYEEEALSDNLIEQIDKNKDVVYLFGPEGGFSLSEVKMFVTSGYKSISLGKRILKAETAMIAGLSIINYLLEK